MMKNLDSLLSFKLLALALLASLALSAQIQPGWYGDSTLSPNHYFQQASPEGGYFALHHGNYCQQVILLDSEIGNRNLYLPFYQPIGQFKPSFNPEIPEAVSEIRFRSGYNNQQWVEVDHQQSMKGWKLLGQYYGNKSEGILSSQGLNHQDLGLGVQTNLGHSQIEVLGRFAKWEQLQNGGLTNDTVANAVPEVQSQLFPVNLTAAIETRYHRDLEVKVKRGFFPTYTSDSIPVLLGYTFHGFGRGYYLRDARTFDMSSPLSQGYENVLIDSSNTFDSLAFRDYGMDYGLEWEKDSVGSFRVYGSSGEQLTVGSIGRSTVGYFRLGGETSLRVKALDLKARAQLTLAGEQTGDYVYNGRIGYQIQPELRIFGVLKANRQTPNASYKRYFSNHFFWNQSLNPVRAQELGGGLRWKGFQVYAFAKGEVNPLYFDETGSPNQLESRTLIGLELKGGHSSGDFNFHHFILLRRSSRNAFPVPNALVRETVDYTLRLFPAKVPISIGLDGYYFSSYYAPEYRPSLGIFSLQRSQAYGNFIRVDAYLAMKVKTLRVLVRVENAGFGIINEELVYAPGSMLTPRNIRLGLVWRFIN